MINTSLGRLSVFDLLHVRQLEHSASLPIVEIEGVKICTPTPEFLASIGEYLNRLWGRAVDATQAYQVWLLYRHSIHKSRVKFSVVGDIAHWFHLDATKLPGDMVLGLVANLSRVQAQEQLVHGTFNSTDYESVYQLVLLATGDEKQALDARSASMKALIEQETRRTRP